MAAHSARTVTDAIITLLEAAPLTVGDGVAPSAGGWSGVPGQSTFVGYVVVHPVSGGVLDGTIDAPNIDADPLYQLSTFGATREQCENIADLCRAEMVTKAALTVAGRSVLQVDQDMLDGARRDDDIQPATWMGVGRYRIFTTST